MLGISLLNLLLPLWAAAVTTNTIQLPTLQHTNPQAVHEPGLREPVGALKYSRRLGESAGAGSYDLPCLELTVERANVTLGGLGPASLAQLLSQHLDELNKCWVPQEVTMLCTYLLHMLEHASDHMHRQHCTHVSGQVWWHFSALHVHVELLHACMAWPCIVARRLTVCLSSMNTGHSYHACSLT